MKFNPVKRRNYGSSHEVIARVFEEAGGVPGVMKILQLSRTRVYAFTDPDGDSEISYARMAHLTRETGATAAAEHLCHAAGGVFTPLNTADSGDWHQLAGRASRKNAASIAGLLAALSDTSPSPGRVDQEEARALLEAVDRQMAVLGLKRAKLLEVLEGRADESAAE